MAFDLIWTADATPGRWNLSGTNNTGGPIHEVGLGLYGRGFSFPPELADGASHMFWGATMASMHLSEGEIPSADTAVVSWLDSDDVAHVQPPEEPEE